MKSFLHTAEIYSLKKNYEKVVTIEGTDQISIKKGMQSGLSAWSNEGEVERSRGQKQRKHNANEEKVCAASG